MKDFQLISGRSESEVRSKLKALQRQGWSAAKSSRRNTQGKIEHFEEGPVSWKENGGMRYYLGVVR